MDFPHFFSRKFGISKLPGKDVYTLHVHILVQIIQSKIALWKCFLQKILKNIYLQTSEAVPQMLLRKKLQGFFNLLPTCHTVDGSEIRLTSWYGSFIPLFTRIYASQVVGWDFVHQPHLAPCPWICPRLFVAERGPTMVRGFLDRGNWWSSDKGGIANKTVSYQMYFTTNIHIWRILGVYIYI